MLLFISKGRWSLTEPEWKNPFSRADAQALPGAAMLPATSAKARKITKTSATNFFMKHSLLVGEENISLLYWILQPRSATVVPLSGY
jgi:hypothetical protein